MALSDSGKKVVSRQEYAEYEFSVKLRLTVDSVFNEYVDIQSIAAPKNGSMLTWKNPVKSP
jgi:hypothetical protein